MHGAHTLCMQDPSEPMQNTRELMQDASECLRTNIGSSCFLKLKFLRRPTSSASWVAGGQHVPCLLCQLALKRAHAGL